MDIPIVFNSVDPKREDHPPFYVSLLVDNLLLHNCMLDSGSLLATFPHSRDLGSAHIVYPTTTQDTDSIEQAPLATPAKKPEFHLIYLIDR